MPDFAEASDAMVIGFLERLGLDRLENLTFEAYSQRILADWPADPAIHEARVSALLAGAKGFDDDGNGVVSRQEFFAPLRDALDQLDSNSDGTLAPDELD